MFNLTRWDRDPWSIFDELESLQEDMNRALTGVSGARRSRRARPGYPLMNVWSSEEGLVIDAELPGVNTSDIDISVKGDVLRVSGKTGEAATESERNYHRRERPSGMFERTLQLPFKADPAGVQAAYRNGLLRITVPRSEEEKPRKIAIQTA